MLEQKDFDTFAWCFEKFGNLLHIYIQQIIQRPFPDLKRTVLK